MKAKQVVFILFVILLGVTSESYAQRRVINTPRRTVVQGRAEQWFTGKTRWYGL